MPHRDGVGRLNGPLFFLRTGVIDTLLHVLAGQVKDRLVGHIAHGLAVDLHRQRIRLIHHVVEHGHPDSQRAERQDVHGHAGQQLHIAPDAVCEEMYTGLQGRAKAFFLMNPVGMNQQRPAAPHKEDDGAKQILEHLCCTGERRDHQVMGQRCKPGRHPQGCRADPPPGADDGIFRRKAQSVQALAHGLHHGGGPHFLGNIVHMVLRFSAEPMSPQQMHTLQPRPERAQLLPARGRRFGDRRHLLLRFCCFFVQQKRMLLPDSSFFPVSKTAPQSFKTAQYISLSFFYYTLRPHRNKHYHRIWRELSRTFHEIYKFSRLNPSKGPVDPPGAGFPP